MAAETVGVGDPEGETEDATLESNFNLSREASDVDDAELYPLMNGTGAGSDDGETPADVPFAKTKREEEMILQLIANTKVMKSTSLDLSQKNLQTLPDELLELSHIEYMYLEGNDIAFLPDEFFKFFSRLRWLDLRNNQLSRIPSIFLSNHACLRNLLLEGNNLRNLPLELGLVKSLHGLNIAGNPLDFPPQEIIDKGTQHILSFLRMMMDAKNTAKMADLELNLSEEVHDGFEQISASSDDWNTTASMMDLAKKREGLHKVQSAEVTPSGGDHNQLTEEEEYSLGAKSAELHRPVRHSENKYKHIQKLKKAGALGVVDKKKKKQSKMSWKVNPYPSPPPQEYAAFRMNEEKQLARVKEFREKTDAILQRRKDDAMLKNWRDESKTLQQKKYTQNLLPGKDYEVTAEQAPFGVEKDRMKVLSKEERLRDDLRREKEIKDQRSVSPATRQRIEHEKQARIRDLEKRIKEHTAGMVERRKQPKGTPQHEMEIARRELEIAEELHGELLERRRDIEYRFKAFDADVTSIVRPNKHALKH
ncbi:leucine-rich repeat-containing protein 27 isoform X2 [Aplysia californica]|uniref:Leucine-rich repeat-containing protein 27 isoform X2 n=1 Tax=Aplysia californica TaxID=6500 RepID=A0ABM1AE64_APLCA|nr:leucine-rich repeat-containing protein 27 isoform X2 [Aplysia californica]